MRIFARILFIYLLLGVLSSKCLAQIPKSQVSPSHCLPVSGEPANTQSLNAGHIALDGVGGFYVISENNIYHVEKEGRLYWVAGAGTAGDSGDDGKAVSAQLDSPDGLAIDTAGNLFIADTWNNRIRKVTPDGVIKTVAGSGYRGYSGDGNQATLGLLNYQRSKAGMPMDRDSLFSIVSALYHPKGVAVDSAGNIYIADSLNSRIRIVGTDGVIATIAGNGYHGYGPDGRSATSAQIGQPYSIFIDSAGNLFIATGNHRICKVTPAGVITTVAGNGTKGYSGDGGPATLAQLNDAHDVAVDSAGNLYIADTDNNRIRKITPAGVITTVAGNGTAGYSGDGSQAASAQLRNPISVAVDSAGNLYIADRGNSRIRKIIPAGIITTVAGNGTGCSFIAGRGGSTVPPPTPTGIAVDSAANLYIAAPYNCIQKVDPDGMVSTVAGNGVGVYTSFDIANLTDGQRKAFISGKGVYSGEGGAATLAQLNHPSSVAVDTAGTVFIADLEDNRIRKVGSDGVITTVAGNETRQCKPVAMATDSVGNLYVGDSVRICKVTPAGAITTVAGNGTKGFSGDGGPAVSAQAGAGGIAIDTAGNLFIADTNNDRIRKVTPAGVITTVAGNGTKGFSGDGGPAISAQLHDPKGVAVDTSGNLFILDSGNYRIRKVAPDGMMTTVLGNTEVVYDGNGRLTALRTFSDSIHPTSIAIDSAGNLYILDQGDDRNILGQQWRVLKITPDGRIITIA
jgi:trimeric autotransporter adhesin